MLRLFHLSDFHFSDDPDKVNSIVDVAPGDHELGALIGLFQTSHHRDLPGRISDFMRNRDDPADVNLVVVTGDLCATGCKPDLQCARLYFISGNPPDVPTYANLLVPKDRLFLMPGNHDRFQYSGTLMDWTAEAVAPGNEEFDLQFADFWRERSAGHPRIAEMEVPAVPEGFPRTTVIAADFCLSNKGQAEGLIHGAPGGYAGQGFADPDIVKALAVATKKRREASQSSIVLWLIHFPPLTRSELRSDERKLRLIDAEAVMDAAHDCGVPLILSGHLHRDFCCPGTGYVRVWCAGAAAVFSVKRPQLHEITLASRASWITAQRKTYTLRRVRGEGPQFIEDKEVDPVTHTWSADAHQFPKPTT